MSGRLTISRRVEWDMAHRLGPRCQTKCRNLHGHRYVAIATLDAEAVDDLGMVLDFGEVFGAMKAIVDGELDHGTLVDEHDVSLLEFLRREGDKHHVVGAPTTVENIVPWLAARFQAAFDALPGAHARGVRLAALRVFETPNCYADWTLVP
ncbi:MAG: 6-carboxytetrahydropterin synthase [Planctomycetota bacterium]